MFKVTVYSGQHEVEFALFNDENEAVDVAGSWQDRGFKVRVENV